MGFGTVGTAFGSTVLGASDMADGDQGVVGGIVNTSRQLGAALGVALLVAIADSGNTYHDVATATGDRRAMLAAAAIALFGTVVALRGTKRRASSTTSAPDLAISHRQSLAQAMSSRFSNASR